MLGRVKRGFWWLFLKIEEPRLIRVLQFVLYVTMATIGGLYLQHPPESYEGVLGLTLAYIFGGLILLGGVLGAFAVLPGIWWLERLAVISLCTGLSIFFVVALSLAASPIAIGVTWALIVSLTIRWFQITDYQLAPGR